MIKNSQWIREKANSGMIEPFVDGQVREVYIDTQCKLVDFKDAKRKVISYGVGV